MGENQLDIPAAPLASLSDQFHSGLVFINQILTTVSVAPQLVEQILWVFSSSPGLRLNAKNDLLQSLYRKE